MTFYICFITDLGLQFSSVEQLGETGRDYRFNSVRVTENGQDGKQRAKSPPGDSTENGCVSANGKGTYRGNVPVGKM